MNAYEQEQDFRNEMLRVGFSKQQIDLMISDLRRKRDERIRKLQANNAENLEKPVWVRALCSECQRFPPTYGSSLCYRCEYGG